MFLAKKPNNPPQIGVFFATIAENPIMHILVYWMEILSCFNYHVVFSNNPFILLNLLPTGHAFKNEKTILWTSTIKTFLRLIWNEGNHCIFKDKKMQCILIFDHLLYILLSWCKFLSFFCDHSHASFIS